jgi:hypothetical protein
MKMKAIEQLERLKRINELIKTKSTGTPEILCAKLGISRRQLFKDLEMFKDMGAEIVYSKIRETYFYPNGHEMEISYSFRIIPKKEIQNINGGFFFKKYQSAFFMHSANLTWSQV